MKCRILAVLAVAIAAAPAAAHADWVTETYPEWQFSAAFPVPPTMYTGSKTDSSGAVAVRTHAFVANDGRIMCLAGISEHAQPVEVGQELTANRDDFVRNAQASVTASRRTTFTRPPGTRLPALEFSAVSADRLIKSIVIVEAKRTYQIVGVQRKDDTTAAAAVSRCVTGLKLTKK